jgi:NTP pyrophosphatase (non-canonical NTP hydrolase)
VDKHHYDFNFPKCKPEDTPEKQLEHLVSEVVEVSNAYFDWQRGADTVEHFAEETMDVIHCAETTLNMISNEVDIDEAKENVIAKNVARGYYL